MYKRELFYLRGRSGNYYELAIYMKFKFGTISFDYELAYYSREGGIIEVLRNIGGPNRVELMDYCYNDFDAFIDHVAGVVANCETSHSLFIQENRNFKVRLSQALPDGFTFFAFPVGDDVPRPGD